MRLDVALSCSVVPYLRTLNKQTNKNLRCGNSEQRRFGPIRYDIQLYHDAPGQLPESEHVSVDLKPQRTGAVTVRLSLKMGRAAPAASSFLVCGEQKGDYGVKECGS